MNRGLGLHIPWDIACFLQNISSWKKLPYQKAILSTQLPLNEPSGATFSGPHTRLRVNTLGPKAKWPAFYRRYFQMHFLKWKFSWFDSNFLNSSSYVEAMVWRRIGDTSLSDPELAWCIDAYMRHSILMCWFRFIGPWNLPDSAAKASIFKAINKLSTQISHLRDFTRFEGRISHRLKGSSRLWQHKSHMKSSWTV